MENNWKLDNISIRFKQGYGWEKKEHKRHDRYEGTISFVNEEDESFCFNIPENYTQQYLDIMANDIVRCATDLGKRLAESIKPKEEE